MYCSFYWCIYIKTTLGRNTVQEFSGFKLNFWLHLYLFNGPLLFKIGVLLLLLCLSVHVHGHTYIHTHTRSKLVQYFSRRFPLWHQLFFFLSTPKEYFHWTVHTLYFLANTFIFPQLPFAMFFNVNIKPYKKNEWIWRTFEITLFVKYAVIMLKKKKKMGCHCDKLHLFPSRTWCIYWSI